MCINHKCDNDTCVTGFEVCEENPANVGREVGRHVCYVAFFVGDDGGRVTKTQHCFDDEHSMCHEKCKLERHTAVLSIYDCCCTGNLCNDVKFNMTGVLSVCLFICLFVFCQLLTHCTLTGQ